MYAGVGAKLVSLSPALQAAAGVGAIDPFDLDVGDLSVCAGRKTGEACRGFEGGGILAGCACINLSDPQTLLELKQLLSDVTGHPLSGGGIWTTSDEQVLLAWASSASGLRLPDVRRPWVSGYVSETDLLQRTPTGWAYLTSQGLLVLLEEAGCLEEGPSGCAKFPVMMGAVTQMAGPAGPRYGYEDALAVEPPLFGAEGGRAPEPLEPGAPVRDAADLELSLEGPGVAAAVTWGLVGAAVVLGAYLVAARGGFSVA